MKKRFCQREHDKVFPESDITSFCLKSGCDKRLAWGLCHHDNHSDHLDCLRPIKDLDKFITNQQQEVPQDYDKLTLELNALKKQVFSNIEQLIKSVLIEKLPVQAVDKSNEATEQLLNKLVESQSFQQFDIKPIQDLVHNLEQIHKILQSQLRISRIYLDVVDQLYEDGTYSGETLNGLIDGIGKFIYNNGNIYTGEWRNDEKHGTGLYEMVNGDSEFKNDVYDGQGAYKLANGESYEGSFINDQSHGYGRQINKNGDIYEGLWKENKGNGYGILKCNDGQYYQGNWKDNNRDGFGVQEWPNGQRYIGNYKDNRFDGQGIFKLSNGNKYEGNFKEGKYDGQGVFHFAEENVKWFGYEPFKITYASDHLQYLFDSAVKLIRNQQAYVCEQTKEEMAHSRMNKQPSPYQQRSVQENLDLFYQMQSGLIPENQSTSEELCLLYANKIAYVGRHDEIVVQYANLMGNVKAYKIKVFMAHLFQHEIDHLDGITVEDRTRNIKDLTQTQE